MNMGMESHQVLENISFTDEGVKELEMITDCTQHQEPMDMRGHIYISHSSLGSTCAVDGLHPAEA